MLKLTVLISLLTAACAMDPDTSSTSSLSTCYDENHCECECPPPPPEGPTCETKKEGVVDLDSQPANLDHDDGKVTFCHATGSASNPFVLITTDVSGCVNGHADHEPGGNDDVFATQGCDD
jgi:hypothetical protein